MDYEEYMRAASEALKLWSDDEVNVYCQLLNAENRDGRRSLFMEWAAKRQAFLDSVLDAAAATFLTEREVRRRRSKS